MRRYFQVELTEEQMIRQKQLFIIGLAKRTYGFSFKEFYVSHWSIKNMSAHEWDQYIKYIEEEICGIKKEMEHPLSDRELLFGFARQLQAISGPETRHHSTSQIVKSSLDVIKDLSEFVHLEATRQTV